MKEKSSEEIIELNESKKIKKIIDEMNLPEVIVRLQYNDWALVKEAHIYGKKREFSFLRPLIGFYSRNILYCYEPRNLEVIRKIGEQIEKKLKVEITIMKC